MADTTLEQHRQALEQEIARIREQYKDQPPAVIGRTAPDFLEKYTGIFADDPLFEEMVRFTEEERERRKARGEEGGAAKPSLKTGPSITKPAWAG